MPNGSFTFCGVDVESIGLEYAPEISETYVYRPADSQSHVETFDAHNGGYYYGSWSGPKTFVLRCFFEEKHIDKGIIAKAYSLFKVGKTGKLVFSRRPWCYYYATVTEPITPEYTNYLNGVITINLQAMYPYGRSNIFTVERTDKNYEQIRANSAVFDKADMELPDEYDLTEKSEIILANPGTERAALGFYVSGDVGAGIIIHNKTTNQKCRLNNVTKEETTDDEKSVFVDPINGKTLLVGEDSKQYAFKYHEYGFIELDPAFPAARDLYVTQTGRTTVNVLNKNQENLTGKYIFIGGGWYKIIGQPDEHTLKLDGDIGISDEERTMAILMNEIEISPITTMDVHIKFVFKPTYA